MSDSLRHLTADRRSLLAALRLLSIGALGIRRARWLLSADEPERVVDRLIAGRLPEGVSPDETQRVTSDHLRRWRDALRAQDPESIAEANFGGHHVIIDAGDHRWPFADDPDPPILLFVAGDPDLLDRRPRVSVVGTRRCSAVGRRVARELGSTLSAAGVTVVSGLALGIDAAAHDDATGPGPRLAVVASGLDVVYPQRNAALWWNVQRTGVMISETPMRERATTWRFPARNRLIAGLSDLVVIVESHARGGALITVDEAAMRGVDVAAVPGAVTSRASDGTNALLMEGVPPVRNGDDVCAWLGVQRETGPNHPPRTATMGSELVEPSPEPAADGEGIAAAVVQAVAGGEVHIDVLAADLDVPAKVVLSEARRLHRRGDVCMDGAMIGPSTGEEQYP